MPSIRTPTPYETCQPCKWFARRMWKSGRDPIYKSYCKYPRISRFPIDDDQGMLIGDNTDRRPDWCPIRGDKQAEQEATADE